MRASHRTIVPNEVWDSTGLPYHPSTRADVDTMLREGMENPPTIRLWKGGEHASRVTLPMIPPVKEDFVHAVRIETKH